MVNDRVAIVQEKPGNQEKVKECCWPGKVSEKTGILRKKLQKSGNFCKKLLQVTLKKLARDLTIVEFTSRPISEFY